MLFLDVKYSLLISSRLRNFKQKQEFLFNFSCPFCGDSRKNTYRARGYLYRIDDSLGYKCHNCSVNYSSISNILEVLDKTLYNEYWFEYYTLKKLSSRNTESSGKQIGSVRFDKIEKRKEFDHAQVCSRLSTDHICIQYLKSRKIPEKYYFELYYTDNFKKFVSQFNYGKVEKLKDEARLIILQYNEYNDLIGIVGRSFEKIKHKYINIPLVDNRIFFGLETINFEKPIKIVEGFLDSIFVDNCMAAGNASLHIPALWLIKNKNVPIENIILIFDNEPRNKEVMKLMEKSIDMGFGVLFWPDNIMEKDINDMIIKGVDEEDIRDIIENNVFRGLSAKTKFAFYNKI